MGGQVEGNESRGLDGGERRPGWVEGGRGVVFPPRVAFVLLTFKRAAPSLVSRALLAPPRGLLLPNSTRAVFPPPWHIQGHFSFFKKNIFSILKKNFLFVF